jgi:uncharacterized protein YxjI
MIIASDAGGTTLFYVRQKIFKLKERVEVFADERRSDKLADIAADRIIDFSANYTISDASGSAIGNIRRRGMRSLWRACYEISSRGGDTYTVREKSVMVRILDGIFGDLPVIGVLSGFVFHPEYLVTNSTGELCYTVKKLPAFFEGKFQLEKNGQDNDDILVSLGTLMLLLLERARG